jgi:phosphatidate cytidylyltransferase
MLWQRVLTALVLVPLVVLATLYLETNVFAGVLGLFVLIASQEMARLANVHTLVGQAGYVLAVAGVLAIAWYALAPRGLAAVQGVIALWWVLVTLSLVFRRRALPRVEQFRPAVLVIGALVLATAWVSMVALHGLGDTGPYLVLALFVIIWLADSGAYFAGRAFGRHKLSPHVSPGKTWAGVGGAVLATLTAAVLLVWGGASSGAGLAGLLLLAVVVTLVSIGGDLWESRLKREAGMKDSGSLLPGHGGMLDRIDSLLAAAPVFGLGVHLVGVQA